MKSDKTPLIICQKLILELPAILAGNIIGISPILYFFFLNKKYFSKNKHNHYH